MVEELGFLEYIAINGIQISEYNAFLEASRSSRLRELSSSQRFRILLIRIIIFRQSQFTEQAWEEADHLSKMISVAKIDDAFIFYCEFSRLCLSKGLNSLAMKYILEASKLRSVTDKELEGYFHMIMAIMYSYIRASDWQVSEMELARPTPKKGHPFYFLWNQVVWKMNMGWILNSIGRKDEAQKYLEETNGELGENYPDSIFSELLLLRAEHGINTPSILELSNLKESIVGSRSKLISMMLEIIEAMIYYHNGSEDNSHLAFQRALKLSEDLKHEDLSFKLWNLASNFYFTKGNLEQVHRIYVLRSDAEVYTQRRSAEFFQFLVAQAAQLSKLHSELELGQIEVIERLAKIGEYRDNETGRHNRRVAQLSRKLAQKIDGLSPSDISAASQLHDLGKIGLPDSILLNPGKLNADERLEMQKHTLNGFKMLSNGKSRLLKIAARIAQFHHEHWDGSGYPNGLKGEDIPIEARIVAIADVYDALTHKRPYKLAWSKAAALKEIRQQSGKHFDPNLVNLFCEILTNKTNQKDN